MAAIAPIGQYANPQDVAAVTDQIDANSALYDQVLRSAANNTIAKQAEIQSLRTSFFNALNSHMANQQELSDLKNQFIAAARTSPNQGDLEEAQGLPTVPTSAGGGTDATTAAPTSGDGSSNNDAVTKATAAARAAGTPSTVLMRARQMLGDQDYIGLCEKFVENLHGQSGLYPTALAAAKSQGLSQDWANIKPGDELFFGAAPENGGDGHVGVYSGNGHIVSATSKGVLDLPISAFNAPVLGYLDNGIGGGGADSSSAGDLSAAA